MGVIHFITLPLDGYFEFVFNTHSSLDGSLSDADSAPTYRVYRAGSDTVVATGTCVEKDDANTTGFYVARAQITTLLGYAVGCDYQVRVVATVDGITQADVVGIFRVETPSGIPPLSASLCQVYCYMRYADGVSAGLPVAAGLGKIEVEQMLSRPTGDLSVYRQTGVAGVTDVSGRVFVNIVRKSQVRLRVTWPSDITGGTPVERYVTITVPDAATYDLGALLA